MCDAISFYVQTYNVDALFLILDRIYKQNTVFVTSMIAYAKSMIPTMINHFPRNCEEWVDEWCVDESIRLLAKLGQCFIKISKFKSKQYDVRTDPILTQLLDHLVICIQEVRDSLTLDVIKKDRENEWVERIRNVQFPAVMNTESAYTFVKDVLSSYWFIDKLFVNIDRADRSIGGFNIEDFTRLRKNLGVNGFENARL